MEIRDYLLSILNSIQRIKALRKTLSELISKPITIGRGNPTIERLQAVLDYDAEVGMLENELNKETGQHTVSKNTLIANLSEAGLKPMVKVAFLTEDEESFAEFYYTDNAELKFIFKTTDAE